MRQDGADDGLFGALQTGHALVVAEVGGAVGGLLLMWLFGMGVYECDTEPRPCGTGYYEPLLTERPLLGWCGLALLLGSAYLLRRRTR